MTGPNPLAALIVQKLAQSAGGGMPMLPEGGMGPIAPGGMPPGPDAATESQLSRELSQLRQADPAAMLRTLTDIKQQLGVVINQTLMSLPGVARSAATALRGLDAAIKEASTAAATASVAAPPINNSLLPPGIATPSGG
ncbi:MAG: hypothetical protein ACRDHG_15470, partial [Anaerolineales bacterium]